jgi:benzoyl-CoA reductase/2-hydroxyglutaryl-CoA dehydratase subunit BcrC/BadD/HgdB
LTEVLEKLRLWHDRRDEFAREWRAGGGKVVAYMCDNFPGELVDAAGMLPFRLRGDPAAPTPNVERYVAPDRATMMSVPAFVDAMIEPVVAGTYEFIDYVVVPHGRKAIESTYESLMRARGAGAPMRDVKLFYLDKSFVPGSAASSLFDRDSLLALKAELERWAGTAITGAALAGALASAQRGRALLARLNRLRIAQPPRLSGRDALLVYSLAGAMPRAEHNQLMEELLRHRTALPFRCGPRIFVAGSPQPSTNLYRVIESLGATVVGEDHCWGERTAGCPTSGDLSGLEGLAERYHRTPACSIEFPLERTLARWRAAVRRSRPNGVLLNVVEGDELHVWDTPDKARLLAEDGLPSLHLARQGYGVPEEELTETIGDWLHGLAA